MKSRHRDRRVSEDQGRFKVIVVDDEPLALQRISRLVQQDPAFDLVDACSSGESAVHRITELQPEVVFLDVQMPEMDGFGVLAALDPDTMPSVIFVTAYDEYAVRAFESSAVDYLLKPVNPERFELAVRKVKTWRSETQPTHIRSLLAQSRYHRLIIKTDGKYLMLNPSEVERISAAGNYAIVYARNRSYIIRETMTSLECRLDPLQFLRVNRSEIVNVAYVQELAPTCHGEYSITTVSGSQVNLTRTYKDALQKILPPDKIQRQA